MESLKDYLAEMTNFYDQIESSKREILVYRRGQAARRMGVSIWNIDSFYIT